LDGNYRRIAFVLPSFAGGGAERVLLTLARTLDRSAFAPEIIVLDGVGPWAALVPSWMRVTNLGRSRIRRALFPLVRTLRKSGADVAVSTIGALNLALLALKPLLPPRMDLVVREANTPLRHANGKPESWFYRWAYPRLYRRAASVIVPATYLAGELTRDFGVPDHRIEVLHNPVDETGLRASATPIVRVPGPGPRYVAVGRLTEQKGFDRLIDMMARVNGAVMLTILGDGPARDALEAQRDRLGLRDRVILPGFAADAARHIAGADALVLSSRWEGMPNVALEALALGTPVIATPQAGGIGEIAQAAPPGAVVLANPGPKFVLAMNDVRVEPVARLRPSLLPDCFRLDKIAPRFAELLSPR
jgi:glycosyltransferase involved in cell wall biosynthesis